MSHADQAYHAQGLLSYRQKGPSLVAVSDTAIPGDQHVGHFTVLLDQFAQQCTCASHCTLDVHLYVLLQLGYGVG